MRAPASSLPLRETTKTSWLSHYRILWRGCKWEQFLTPCKGGFPVARIAPTCIAGSQALPETPGVYELALVKGGADPRYKVYVGQTSSLRRRFHLDYRGVTGSHLRPFFDEALRNGCEIWRRCRPLTTAPKALSQEAKLLRQYDYAWNMRQAGCQPRHIDIITQRSCFKTSTHLVSCPALPLKTLKGSKSLDIEANGPLGFSLLKF